MSISVVARIEDKLAKDIDFLQRKEKLDKSAVIRRLLTKAVKEEKIDYALTMYRNKKISIAKAAEIAEIPLVDMLTIAAEHKIPVHYTKNDLMRDFKAAWLLAIPLP